MEYGIWYLLVILFCCFHNSLEEGKSPWCRHVLSLSQSYHCNKTVHTIQAGVCVRNTAAVEVEVRDFWCDPPVDSVDSGTRDTRGSSRHIVRVTRRMDTTDTRIDLTNSCLMDLGSKSKSVWCSLVYPWCDPHLLSYATLQLDLQICINLHVFPQEMNSSLQKNSKSRLGRCFGN